MKSWGIVLLLAGSVIALISFVLPVSVDTYSSSYLSSGSVINIGKLQTQMLVFHSGVALFLAGAIFAAAGELAERIRAISIHSTAQAPLDERTAAVFEPRDAVAVSVVEDPAEPSPEELAQRAEDHAKGNRADLIMFILFGGLMLVVLVLAIRGSGLGS